MKSHLLFCAAIVLALFSGLSAHADRRELLAWLRAIPNVRRVALHHGDVEAQEAFAAYAFNTTGWS